MAPVREVCAAALLGVLGVLEVDAQVQLPGWNDTFCHSPDTVMADGSDCTMCCMPEASGFTIRGWTGGDTTTSWYDSVPWPAVAGYIDGRLRADGVAHPPQLAPLGPDQQLCFGEGATALCAANFDCNAGGVGCDIPVIRVGQQRFSSPLAHLRPKTDRLKKRSNGRNR